MFINFLLISLIFWQQWTPLWISSATPYWRCSLIYTSTLEMQSINQILLRLALAMVIRSYNCSMLQFNHCVRSNHSIKIYFLYVQISLVQINVKHSICDHLTPSECYEDIPFYTDFYFRMFPNSTFNVFERPPWYPPNNPSHPMIFHYCSL